MKMSKYLFVVYTPYQLISAISTIKTYQLSGCDLILMHSNMEKYSSALNGLGIDNVYIYTDMYDHYKKGSRLKIHFQIFATILKKRKLVSKKQELNTQYDALFVPSDDTSCRAIYWRLKKNSQIKLFLIDDGVGTYTGEIFNSRILLGRILYSIILTNKFYENVDAIFCYHPELLAKKLKNVTAKKILFHDVSAIFLPYLKKYRDCYIGKKVVFLDQGYDSNGCVNEALNCITDFCKKDDIIIKLHPRLNASKTYDGYECVRDGLPFEVLASTFQSEEYLIISVSSTGCIGPYLLENKKPYVIILNAMNINEKQLTTSFFDQINSNLSEQYVKMPKNIAELKTLLCQIMPTLTGIK